MTTSSIVSATLGDLIAFNAKIESLAQAGLLPTSSCFANPEVARTSNYRFASQIALKTSQGVRFADAFCSAAEMPVAYRLAFVAWHCSNRTPQSFDLLKGYQPRHTNALFRKYLSLQLGCICAVAFCVLVLWVWNAVPSLIGMYLQERASLGIGALFLQFLHEWLFIWAIGVPLIAIGFLSWRRLVAKRIPLQVDERLLTSQQEAMKYDFLSLLNSSGLKLEDSMETYDTVVGSSNRSGVLSTSQANLDISRWAVHQRNELKIGWRNTVNAFSIFAALGGLVVFGVAMTLFQPMIELLLHLCQYGGS